MARIAVPGVSCGPGSSVDRAPIVDLPAAEPPELAISAIQIAFWQELGQGSA